MQDFNFFANYFIEQKKERKKNSINIYSIIALVILLAILVSAIFNFVRMSSAKSSIKESDIFMSDPDNISKLEEVDRITSEIEKIGNDTNLLISIEKALKDSSSVIVNVLDFMNEQVTEDMYFDDLSISKRKVNVSGRALTRLEVAQFEYNVRNSGYFNNVFVGNIGREEKSNLPENFVGSKGKYSQRFDANFSLKDSIYGMDNMLLGGDQEETEEKVEEEASHE